RRQPLLAGGHTRNRERVARIALPLAAQPLSLPFGQRAAHVDDLFVALEQKAGDPAADPPAALNPEPPLVRRQLQHPDIKRPVGARLITEHARSELAAELVDQTDSERAFVRVDPDRDHPDPPPSPTYDSGERRASTRTAATLL